MKPRPIRRFVSVVVLLICMEAYVPFNNPRAVAHIYRWDNGELLTTKDAEPGAQFGGSRGGLGFPGSPGTNLSYADLREADLADADFWKANLTFADLTGANLEDVRFSEANLTSADFDGAVVAGANFSRTTSRGFTAEQFYSTASYQHGQLSGIGMGRNYLSGWDFAGANLEDAWFGEATLTSAGFAGADLEDASFYRATVTSADFAGANLTGASLGKGNFNSADFAGANLTGAWFGKANLTSANFAGAVVAGAMFEETTSSGFTAEQFYSTATYRDGDLSAVGLGYNNLSGWDFAGKDLTAASFHRATLTSANFEGAVVAGATFSDTTSRGFTPEQLYSTASYQNGDLSAINNYRQSR